MIREKTRIPYLSIRRIVLLIMMAMPGVAIDAISQVRRMSIQDHTLEFRPRTMVWIAISIAVLTIVEKVRKKTRQSGDTEDPPSGPFAIAGWLLCLLPLATIHWFWTAQDMISRLKWSFGIALVVYIVWGWRVHLHHWLMKLGLFLRQRLILVVLCCFYLAGLLVMVPGLGFTGDEPHYLLITQSIVEDHDIDVANNYLSGHYGLISPTSLKPHAWLGKGKEIHYYSIHMPGLALLLAPFYALGLYYPPVFAWVIRAGMLLLGLWSIAGFYKLANRVSSEPENATLATLLFGLTVPTFFYAYHLYPALVALGLVTRAFATWIDPHPTTRQSFLAGCLVGILVFFGTKFLGIMLAWLLITAVKRHNEPSMRRSMNTFAIPILAGIAAYLGYLFYCYGQFNPMAVYAGGAHKSEALDNLAVLFLDPKLWNIRISSLLNYFIDQRDGLLFYSPVYIMGLLGWVHWYRRDAKKALYSGVLFVAHIGMYSFFTHRGGYAPPARPIMPVLWVPALAWPAWWRSKHRPWVRTFATICIVYSLLIPWFMMTAPISIYQSTNHDVALRAGTTFARLSNLAVYLPNLLPSYVKSKPGPWWPNYGWGIVFLTTLVLYLVRLSRHRVEALIPPHPRSTATPATVTGAVALVFVLLASAYPRIAPARNEQIRLDNGKLRIYYHKRLCKLSGHDAAHATFLCRRNREHDFVLQSLEGDQGLNVVLDCVTPGRLIDYSLYWFDLHPVPLTVKKDRMIYYSYHWPYWPKFGESRWGFARVVSARPLYITCRDLKVTFHTRTLAKPR